MSPEPVQLPAHGTPYQIIVEGKIDASWSDWLSGMRIASRKQPDGVLVTILSGVLADQAALRGLLNRLWDLNLVLRSVQPFDPDQSFME